MKLKNFFLFGWLFLSAAGVYAQNLPEQNCPGAIPVCSPIYTQNNSYVGFGTLQELNSNNQGCLFSAEKNDVWYVINVTTSGTLAFTITPNNLSDDYDFGVWDVTGVGCSAIYNYITNTQNNYLPIGCNYSGVSGATGLSTTITGPQWEPALNVIAGQTLVLNVSNYSSTQSGYVLDFTPSTASIYDTVKPKFISAGSHCNIAGSSLTVTMSEPILCSSLAGDGSDFYLTPAIPGVTNIVSASSPNCSSTSLTTNTFTLQFASSLPPGTYLLHSQEGTDGNSILDNCGNQQNYSTTTLPDSISFTLNAGTPPVMTILDTPACIKARLILDRGVKCNTIAANGSDFFITGPSTLNVTSATAINCDALNMTDTIDLTFDRSAQVAGVYTLHVQNGTDGNTMLDTCGAAVNNTISWTVSDQGVDAVVTPNLICDPGYVQLSATTALQPSPSGYQYHWVPSATVADTTAASTLAYVNENTTYQVSIVDKDFCIRRDTTHVTISIRNPEIAPITNPEICIGDNIQINASGGLNYAWYPANDLSCTDCPNPVAAPLQTTQYFVAISDQYNCIDTLSQTIVVHPLPIVNAGYDLTIYFGEQTQLAAGTNAGIIYAWEPPTGLNYNNVPNPIASPKENTTYTVTVIDENQCRNTDSVTVFVRSDIPVIIPSAFSPNGDGRNDVFRVGNTSFHRLQEFRVFNRWGQEIFSTTDSKKGWDGTFKGVPQETGVYNYIIRVSYPDGRVEMYKGDVTLVR
jgi:gliding motility-associated-like protein